MIAAVLIVLMGMTASVASFSLKKAMLVSGGLNVKRLLKTPFFYLGGLLYILPVPINLYLLKMLPYSLLVPLGSLTYIWTLMIGNRFLGEVITKQKIFGILLIMIGVCLIVGTT